MKKHTDKRWSLIGLFKLFAIISVIFGLNVFAAVELAENSIELDESFNPGSGIVGTVLSVVLQPDGRAVIAGGIRRINGVKRNGIARLNTDGTVDESFVFEFVSEVRGRDLILQADGKIIFVEINSRQILRLNSDGSRDFSFGVNLGVRGNRNRRIA